MDLQEKWDHAYSLGPPLVALVDADPPGCIGQRSQDRLDILFELQGETFIFQSYSKRCSHAF